MSRGSKGKSPFPQRPPVNNRSVRAEESEALCNIHAERTDEKPHTLRHVEVSRGVRVSQNCGLGSSDQIILICIKLIASVNKARIAANIPLVTSFGLLCCVVTACSCNDDPIDLEV